MTPLTLQRSTRPGKKFAATLPSGKIVHFGGEGFADFDLWKRRRGLKFALCKRKAYLKRHRVIELKNGRKAYQVKYSPAWFSMRALWDYPKSNELFKAIVKLRNRNEIRHEKEISLR